MNLVLDEQSYSYRYHEQESVFSDHDLSTQGWLINFSNNDPGKKSQSFKIFHHDKLIAAAWVLPAAEALMETFSITQKRLENSIFLQALWIAPEANGAMPAILYLALRRGRVLGKKQIVMLLDSKQALQFSMIRVEEVNDVNVVAEKDKQLFLYAQQLQYALHLCYQHCQGSFLEFVKQQFADEIIQTVTIFLRRFFNNKWSQAILNKRMTKQQYIQCLFNLHSYVRYTTRLCARCVAVSDDPDLRNHYIEHLKGEINHEKIIERDLKHLGADVDYLMNYFVPNLATKEFMITQESTIAFYQDPVLMLACPLAAEGITAAITSEFTDALRQLVASWSIAKPEDAIRFIVSHTNTDGGEDGHWENVKRMTQRFIQSEHQLQQFLSIYEIATEGLQRSFESCIEENGLWSI